MDAVLNYVLYFFFYSFLGWIAETIYCSLGEKKFVNRGFLAGPMCPIYGSGATLFGVCLMPFYDKFGYSKWYIILLVVVLGMILADVLEFVTSVIMEKLFNARWWDYSNKKFNIQGRICLSHTCYWGIAAGIFIYVVHPQVVKLFASVLAPQQRNQIIAMILVVFAIDLFFAVKGAFNVRKFINKLNSFSDSVSQSAEKFKSNVSQTYENIQETAQKGGMKFAVWAADVSRQLSEMENPFRSSDKKEKRKDRLEKNNADRLYRNVGTFEKSAKTKMKSIEELVEELKNQFFDEDEDKDNQGKENDGENGN